MISNDSSVLSGQARTRAIIEEYYSEREKTNEKRSGCQRMGEWGVIAEWRARIQIEEGATSVSFPMMRV